jgi:F-type H+-transporting ATPase subunit b
MSSAAAFAAEKGHGEAPDWGALLKNFGYRVLVFVIFVAILYKILKQPLLDLLNKRTEDIQKSIKDAQDANETAKTEIENYKLKMKSFEQDLETMKQKSLKAAEAEKNAILEDAERQIEKLSVLAESRIESDYKKASEELKRSTILKAVEAAKEKLGTQLSPDVQKSILHDYRNKLGVEN